MSNMHILTQSGGKYRVALHVSIPAGNNQAGVSWATALINSGLGGKTALVTGNGAGQITSTELTNITNGTLFEEVNLIDVTQGGTLTTTGQQATFLNDFYNNKVTEIRNALQAQLLWFGQNL